MLAQPVVQILPDSTLLSFADFKNGFLQPLALADVANRARNQHSLFGLQRTQADLHRKFVAVLVQGVQFHARAHRPHPRLREKVSAVRRMISPQSLRHQLFDLFSQKLLPRIAKQFFHLRIHQDNFSLLVHDHDRIGRRFQQSAKAHLRPLLRR